MSEDKKRKVLNRLCMKDRMKAADWLRAHAQWCTENTVSTILQELNLNTKLDCTDSALRYLLQELDIGFMRVVKVTPTPEHAPIVLGIAPDEYRRDMCTLASALNAIGGDLGTWDKYPTTWNHLKDMVNRHNKPTQP